MSNQANDLASPVELLSLAGRVVVVTGASGSIGTGIVRRVVQAGASVLAQTHNRPFLPVDGLARDQIKTISADLTEPNGPELVIQRALDHFGRLDGLVNNAGLQPTMGFDQASTQQSDSMLALNVTAPRQLTQLAAAAMQGGPSGGSIVNIASIESRQPAPDHGLYAESKAALVMQTKAAAQFYGPSHIRVNSISPGLIFRPNIENEWPEGVERWRSAAPLKRLGRPDDVGDACVFLLSDLARWITGVDLAVDGGVLVNPTW